MEIFFELAPMAALLTVVLAFYTLVAKERKTPTVVNKAYFLLLFIITMAFLVGMPQLLARALMKEEDRERFDTVFKLLSIAATAVIYLAVIFNLYQEWMRAKYFRTGVGFHVTNLARKFQKAPVKSGAGSPRFNDAMIGKILAVPHLDPRELGDAFRFRGKINGGSISATTIVSKLPEANELILGLAKAFLESHGQIYYVTCSRHPVEIISALEKECNTKAAGSDDASWVSYRKRIFVIDGYTPHFGFGETIHRHKSGEIAELLGSPRNLIDSDISYAGLHSAVAKSYAKNKDHNKNHGHEPVVPSLMIYEGCHALVDLESSEQYRIFIRHVMPSERLWGGMMTLFVETMVTDDNLAVLEESSDSLLNLRDEKTLTTRAAG